MKKELESDSAVSTVVIMMVLLAIILIFITVFVNVYIPQTKESAEILHSEDVKDTFLKITSDINQIYSANMIGIISESIPLGGSASVFSTTKSAGYLSVELEPLSKDGKRVWVNISCNDSENNLNLSLNTINITYKPVFTNWENQWYKYKNGVVWVNKNNDRKTPLNTFTILDGNNLEKNSVNTWIREMSPQSFYTIQPINIEGYNYTVENKTDNTISTVTVFEGYTYEGESAYIMNVVDFCTENENDIEYASGTGNANLYFTINSETFKYNLADRPDAVMIANEPKTLTGGKRTLTLNIITATVSVR